MATISISKQLSGVTINSTATITEKSRSGTSVVLNVNFSSYLNESGWIGTGYSVKATITAYNTSKSFTLKNTSSSWSGTTKHTTSGTMTVTVPATVTSIYLGFKLIFDGTSASKSSTLTISKVLASVSSVTDFSDTTNPVMYFKNPAGFKIRPYLNFYDKAGGTKLLTVYPSGSSTTGNTLSSPYTWSLTETQRNTIRNKLKTKTWSYCAVGLEAYDDGKLVNTSSKASDFTNNIAPPIFTDFSYEDIGGTTIDESVMTLDLTGNSQRIIKGYSKLKISMSTPAEAQKGATMSHYSINGIKYTYTDNFEVEIDKWANEKITIYAVDSRGISKEVSKICDLIDYSPLSKGTISVKREGNIGVQTILSYDGSFWNNNFGTEEVPTVDNTLQASYKFRKTSDSSYTEGTTTINPTSQDNKFSFEDYILGDSSENGFNIDNSYEVVVNVKDKLSEITYSAILGSGIPALAIYKNNVAIHGKYDEDLGGTQVNGDLFLNGSKIAEPCEITAYLSSDISFPSSSDNYSFIDLDNSVVTGNKLQLGEKTVSGTKFKGIIVGSGVSKIKINATTSFRNNNQTSPMYFVLYICRLRGETAEFISRMPTLEVPINGLTDGVSISPFDFDVQEGDLFYLRMYKSIANGNCDVIGSSTEMRTYLTAEVVE